MQDYSFSSSVGNNYLLVIALNRFKFCKPLFYSVQDAQALIRVLEEHYAFDPAHTIRLFNERATHIAIWKSLDTLSQKLTEKDTLLVYYAGYSYLEEDSRSSCFLGYDSNLEGPFGLIYHEAFINRLDKLPAKDIFLMVNSGFSSSLIQESPEIINAEWQDSEDAPMEAGALSQKTRWGIASMPIGQLQDRLVGDSPAFARSICGYLDSNRNREIKAKELFLHVQEIPTYDISKPIGGYIGEGTFGEGGFVFLPKSKMPKQVVREVPREQTPQGIEEKDWQEAMKIHTVQGYMDFIWKYPDSKFNSFAQSRIRNLQGGGGLFTGIGAFFKENVIWLAIGVVILGGVIGGLFLTGKLPGFKLEEMAHGDEVVAEGMGVDQAIQEIESTMISLEGGIFKTSQGEVRGISKFEMGHKEVSQAQWKAIMGSRPTGVRPCLECPVENVSWRDVQRFIQLLNERTGDTYRLPTEAEWEFCATDGGALSQDTILRRINGTSWYLENAEDEIHPIGSKAPNSLGFYDMFGNASEWCFDRMPGSLAEAVPAQSNPCGEPLWPKRVSKGGRWSSLVEELTPGFREGFLEIQSEMGQGFRLARGGVPACEEDMKTAFHYPAIEMVTVAGGTFDMGPDADGNTYPVKLNSYQIGKFEVSQEIWEAIMGDNPSWNLVCSSCPVETVSWEMVQNFIQTLNEKRGTTYRLPTEAEWEFAARGGIQKLHNDYAGIDDLEMLYRYGNCFMGEETYVLGGKIFPVDEFATIAPVGSFLPNGLGIYDLSGNVWEFCQDWIGPYPELPVENPKGPESGTQKVVRGGGWNGVPMECSLAFRGSFLVGDSGKEWIGFRLARDL